jgi:hypothetical protein
VGLAAGSDGAANPEAAAAHREESFGRAHLTAGLELVAANGPEVFNYSGNRTVPMMRPNSFRWLSLPTGLLYLWLFYQLLFTPTQMLQGFGVGAEAHTVFLAQRISALMLGFSVLLLLSLGLPPSRARGAIAAAISVNMAGFAINSFWGATHGLLNDSAIPVIGCIEALIAAGYGVFAVSDFLKSRGPVAKR